MKKIMSLALVMMFIVASLLGCGNKVKVDGDFVKNVGKGLEARWVIADKLDESKCTNEEYREKMGKAIDKEIAAIGNVSEYQFSDANLKELATKYMDALNTQKEGLSKYGLDDEVYNQKFGVEGLNVRTRLICDLHDNYGLTVSRKNADTLDELLKQGYEFLKADEKKATYENIVGEDVVLEATGGSNYKLKFTNDSGMDLDDVKVLLNFLGDDGAVVGNEFSYITVANGASNTSDVYFSDDVEFSSVQMAFGYYDDVTFEEITTEYKEISYVNDMNIEIVLKTSPVTVSSISSYSGVQTSAEISSAGLDDVYWSDYVASGYIVVKGTKTYDQDGDNSSDSVNFLGKLYDETGAMIGSGDFYCSNVMVGDPVEAEAHFELTSGKYTLELLDYEY